MATQGRFIVVEGLEGAGKSTAVEIIRYYLTQHALRFITTREPGGTTVGEAVRSLIKHMPNDECLDAKAELLLLYASRVQLVEQTIKPALNEGVWVLSDRFELSTYAYQGGGRGIADAMIAQLSDFCLKGFAPDLIFFMDVSPKTGLERALMRGSADRIEQESLDFFTRVSNAYHAKIKEMKHVVVIDANQSVLEVQQQIKDALAHYLCER